MFDVFISYRHVDHDTVMLLVKALERRRRRVSFLNRPRLRVWWDQSGVEDFGSITDAAQTGLANSKALVAFYSKDYPVSSPCQWELTLGFLAAGRLGDPRDRVLVVNPELGPMHIEPVELRDARYSTVDQLDQRDIERAADAIAAHVAALKGELGSGIVAPSLWSPSQPASAPRFVGRRTEMWRIHSALHSQESGLTQGTVGPGVAQIRGLAGIGKTLLAREYALRFSAAYPGGIFWLQGSGKANGVDAMSLETFRRQQLRSVAYGVIGAENAAALEAMSSEDVEAALREAFTTRETSLWVVDDLPPSLAAEEVDRWIGPAPVKTLIVTRSGEYTSLLHGVALDVLDAEEALRLLSTWREPADAGENLAARAVAEELGGHALALDVAGATLRFQAYNELLERLREPTADELELAAQLREVLPTGHERSISATLARSLNQLDGNARDLLLVGSLVARAAIPAELFAVVLAKLQPQPADAAAAAMLALDQIHSFSLITQTEVGSWQIHPLVARTVELTTCDLERLETMRAATVAALNDQLEPAELPAARLRLLPHAQKLVENPRTADELTLLSHVAAIEHHGGNYQGAAASLEKLVRLRQELLGARDERTLNAIADLAASACDVGDYKRARELQEGLFVSQEQLLGPTDPGTLWTMNNLATTYHLLGDLRRARELRERALSVAREQFGANDRTTLALTRNLAVTINELGDPQTARELGQQALDGLQELLAPTDLELLGTMNNVALIHVAAGDLEQARTLQEEVLARERELLGPKHPDTLGAMANLANILSLSGDSQAAYDLMQGVFAAQHDLLGARHPETIKTQGDIATLLHEQGDFEESRALNEKVVDARQELLGPHHPDTLGTMGNLAHTLRDLGDVAGARELGMHVIAEQTEVLGAHHPETLSSIMHLSITLWQAGDQQGSREWQEAAAAGFRQALGTGHPTTLSAMRTLVSTLLALGDVEGARTLTDEIRAWEGGSRS
jgi:Tetratricopeptide repeat/TIR domain